jgi:transcriptional regulator with XRE-family HTH domain
MENVIGRFLTTQREKSGLSRPRLAEQTGVALNTVRNYELGHSSPSLDFVIKSSKILNYKIEDLTDLKVHHTNESCIEETRRKLGLC